MLDTHAAALEVVDEAFHNFLLRYKPTGKFVYGFVEGRDDPIFYRNVIERFLPDEWSVELIKSGSKEKAIRSFSCFDWSRYDAGQICLFVDRDLDELYRPEIVPSLPNVYVTDGYSIENSIVDDRMFLRLLVEAYSVVDLSPDEEDSLRNSFREDCEAFQNALEPIMALILHWRQNRVMAYLDNLDLKPLFQFSKGRLLLDPAMSAVEDRLSHAASAVGAAKCSSEEHGLAVSLLKAGGGCGRLTRGKYLLWFLAHLLENVHESLDHLSSTYKKPPKVKAPIGVKNIMYNAAPRARCPASLRRFIENTYLDFIARSVRS